MTIWKFEVTQGPANPRTTYEVRMPRGARILRSELQRDAPFIWALVNPRAETETRYFVTLMTGDEVPENATYWATFQFSGGAFVLHLFELPS